ncbi:MAG TPA: GYD domain-containing protein [Vicinamibacterales bacterium]|nr:GYD domain-containing protein [Vicinamibacterales bacterium]
MAKYVTLYQFTDQGVRNVKDSPARLKAAVKKAESMGMKIVAAYYTQGPYDLVAISEVSDEKAATAFALATAAQGNVRSTTMRAFDPDEFEAIAKMIS